MNKSRVILTAVFALIATITISSCSHRTYYGPDYGYGYGYRYHRPLPPPPPRRVVVVPARPHRVIHADRHRPSRYDKRHYRQQYRHGDHYGNRARTRGPR